MVCPTSHLQSLHSGDFLTQKDYPLETAGSTSPTDSCSWEPRSPSRIQSAGRSWSNNKENPKAQVHAEGDFMGAAQEVIG